MKILAFDQAINNTGWAFLDNGLKFGHILSNKKDLTTNQKIDTMVDEISNMIIMLGPDIVILEDVVLQVNPSTMKNLAVLQGEIIGVCKEKGIKYHIMFPTEWRKILKFNQGKAIKRQNLKEQSVNYVATNYSIYTATEDECDAICIANAYKTYMEEV